MSKVTLEFTPETIKDLLIQLPPDELKRVLEGLQNRLQTFQMMELAESAFSEWLSPEEDLYNE